MSSPRTTSASEVTSLWSPSLRWTSLGSLVMILLSAFESMAVTTVMPIVARDLNGESLYSVAFAATWAASIIGMVVSGRWSDRSGPTPALMVAVGLFLAGLIIAGTAVDMPIFVVGRFLQGLGAGAITVCLYVIVARAYPAALHPRVFGMFAAAWVIPSMVGPFFAGVINDVFSWHWVFLIVAILILPALGLLGPALTSVRGPAKTADSKMAAEAPNKMVGKPRAVGTGIAILLATIVAAGLVGIGSLAEGEPGPTIWALALGMFVVVLIALHWLLPKGTMRASEGLPATILMRATLTAAFFGTEIYLPRLLQDEYLLSASISGLVLTVGSISWAAGSAIQARLGDRVSPRTLLLGGSVLVVVAIMIELATVLLGLGPISAGIGWLIGGSGMGLAYPCTSTLVLAFSTPQDQGFNSSAMSISDSVGGSAATAFAGLLFVAVTVLTGFNAYAACFLMCLVLGIFTLWVANRAGEKQPSSNH